jgi:hypothetical protein
MHHVRRGDMVHEHRQAGASKLRGRSAIFCMIGPNVFFV